MELQVYGEGLMGEEKLQTECLHQAIRNHIASLWDEAQHIFFNCELNTAYGATVFFMSLG